MPASSALYHEVRAQIIRMTASPALPIASADHPESR